MMLGNYFNSAFRALQRDKFHALLNMAGLTVSLAVTFLITLYIKHEFSYENFFTEPDRVFLVFSAYENAGEGENFISGTPYPVLDALRTDFPNELTATFVGGTLLGATTQGGMSRVITVQDRAFRETVAFVDEQLFDVLDFPMAFGQRSSLTEDPNKVILTESMAEKLFGKKNAIGEILEIEGQELEVAAIRKDDPKNSTFRDQSLLGEFGIFMSQSSPLFLAGNQWGFIHGMVLVRLATGVDAEYMENQLQPMMDRHLSQNNQSRIGLSLSLLGIDRIHLEAGGFGIADNRNLVTAYALSIMAALLLVIACFNYINLSTARAFLRIKEVSVRKILGAKRAQLTGQFLGETLLTTTLSFALACVIATVLLPIFSVLIDRPLDITDLLSPNYLLAIAGLTLFISLMSGFYPAMLLASARPSEIFGRNKYATGSRKKLRSAIVGVQFGMTICLVVAALVSYNQASYMQNLDYGFRKDSVLIIPNVPAAEQAELREAYNQQLLGSPFIQEVGSSNYAPSVQYSQKTSLHRIDQDGSQWELWKESLRVLVDDAFFDVYGVNPLAGRGFSETQGDALITRTEDGTRNGRIIVSESAVSLFGYSSPAAAVGQVLVLPSHNPVFYEIIGVVPDIQFRLARAAVLPTTYFYSSQGGDPDDLGVTSALISPGGLQEALLYAEQTWHEMFPDKPFEYEILEDRISSSNAEDRRLSNLFISLTGLAIAITCLGLFGLVSFVAARRTREVAIRKALGGKTHDVARLLIWEFAKPILIANLVAWPVAWIMARRWLDGFTYRIDLSPWFFISATLLALAIAFLTVIGRTWKAAQTHPAQALKYE